MFVLFSCNVALRLFFFDDYGDNEADKYVDKEAEDGGGDDNDNDNGSDDNDVVGIHTQTEKHTAAADMNKKP